MLKCLNSFAIIVFLVLGAYTRETPSELSLIANSRVGAANVFRGRRCDFKM
jgi:hypothetical protein